MTTAPTAGRVFSAPDLLQAASSQAMEDTLSQNRHRFRRWKRWLTAKHPYSDVITALEPKSKQIDGAKLAEYIASSIPLHVADGWVFLSRAFDAIRCGDRNTAAHLAYYAELRAAMSLLASEGIGVFNNRHVAIGQQLVPTDWANIDSNRGRGVGTHYATWQLLGSWADDPGRASTILTAITVESRTISDWFGEARISQSVQHLVARQWLQSWSIDLQYFPIDRDLRNHTSYRPSRITPAAATAVDTSADVVDPLLQTWDALVPSADAGGAAIDRALLSRALSLAYDRQNRSEQDWGNFVDRLQGAASSSLQSQLKDAALSNYYVLKCADDPSRPPITRAVLSRATLLLRIANGVCAQRLANAQVTRQDLEFWWTRVGEDEGLWSRGTEPEPFADLWAEVNDAIDDTETALASISTPREMSKISEILSQGVSLTQYSRAALWLLGVD